MNVSVSAIIPVYNPDLSYLHKAIWSVLSQTYPVLELVIVNDGGNKSFINTLPIDPRIRVFSKPNEGVAATRNYAIKQCNGDYIAFLDQDDYWFEDKLQEQIITIPIYGEPCMVSSPVDIIQPDGINLNKYSISINDKYRQKTSHENVLLCLTEANFIYSSTPLIHYSIFENVGFFDTFTQPHDDWDMYLRIMLAGYPVYFYKKKSLSVWRKHEYNESNNSEIMIRSRCRVEKKLLNGVVDENIKSVSCINLLIDYLERDNLLYKKRKFKRFRSFIKHHLTLLLFENKCILSKTGSYVQRTLNKRYRKIAIKSIRRYVASYFLSKKYKY